jgi:hypothetical protein
MMYTIFLAQLLGSFLIIVTLSLLFKRQNGIKLVNDLAHNQILLYVLSIIGVLLGLIVVLTHNAWSDGSLSLLITLIGWIMLIKSILAMVLPAETVTKFVKFFTVNHLYNIWFGIALIFGLYLSYAGFLATY